MKFKGRLERLGAPGPSSSQQSPRPASPLPPPLGTPRDAVSQQQVPHEALSYETPRHSAAKDPAAAARLTQSPFASAAASGSSKDLLDELRDKMALLLQKKAAVFPSRAAADLGELPLVRVESDSGWLTRRLEVLGRAHCVGRVAVQSAQEVAPELLSLLALDPRLAAVDPRRALYIDTETTGLGGAGTLAFLVGLAWFNDEGCLVLEQLLLASPEEEGALLDHIRTRVESASLLVSFNGKSFDIPLLEARLVMNGRPKLAPRAHLDLLHVARRLHKARLGTCRLTHLESEVLGWQRGEDDIAGADIAPLYGHFLRTGDGETLRAVVEHNAWDVITMAALVGLYGEPVRLLHPQDLVGVAEVARRHRAFDQARCFADASLDQGGGAPALRVRAHIEKARGDKARALLDFEALSLEVNDPADRLELAKLYEHHKKDFSAALALLDQGLLEDDEATARRRARLLEKVAKTAARAPRVPRAPHSRGRRYQPRQ